MNEETKQTPKKKYYDYISVGNRTKQSAYFVEQHDKNKILKELLKDYVNKQILVVLKSKKSADTLMQYLNADENNSLAVHGNHRASQIEEGVDSFNSQNIKILITTDKILEIMNLEGVEVLVNYDLALVASDYFKRLLLVDEIGESVSLINSEDEVKLGLVELLMRCEMEEKELKGFEHTPIEKKPLKNKTKKPRHKKVPQNAKKRKAKSEVSS